MKKGDLLDLVASTLEDPEKVRNLYAGLNDVGQKSVQDAAYSSDCSGPSGLSNLDAVGVGRYHGLPVIINDIVGSRRGRT